MALTTPISTMKRCSTTHVAFMSSTSIRLSTLSKSQIQPFFSSTSPSSLSVKQARNRHGRHNITPTRPHPLPQMTLQPKDCSWRSERDLRAIESEFLLTIGTTGAVDSDMQRLRRRMIHLGRKEKQWADFCQQFASLSVLTGIPLVSPDNGNPTRAAWVFLSFSAALPLYLLCIIAHWIHASSATFQPML